MNLQTPTSLPEEQLVNKCQCPAPSDPPFAPRHAENVDNRSLRSSPGPPPSRHPTFHGLDESTWAVVVGHAPLWTLSSTRPREMLKEL